MISGQSGKATELPRLQAQSPGVTSGGEIAAMLTSELSTLTMNALSIPLAWSDCVAGSRLAKRVQQVEDGHGVDVRSVGTTWTYDGITVDWPMTGRKITRCKRRRDPFKGEMKLSGGDKGKNLQNLGHLNQKEKDSNSSDPQPWLVFA